MARKKSKAADRDNTELWESGALGMSEEHAVQAPAELESAVDEVLGLQLLSFRIQKPVIEQLKQLAKLEGIGYQPLMRRIICNYVRENEHRLLPKHSLSESTQQADNLFAKSLQLAATFDSLPALSSERINAENAYARHMQESLALFTEVLNNSNDIVLKTHAHKRIEQIEELCQRQTKSKKQNPKKQKRRRQSAS